MLSKLGKITLTLYLFFIRYIRVTRVQSSMNDINHLALETLRTIDGPQTSPWMREKRTNVFVLLIGKEEHLCLANLQLLQ